MIISIIQIIGTYMVTYFGGYALILFIRNETIPNYLIAFACLGITMISCGIFIK